MKVSMFYFTRNLFLRNQGLKTLKIKKPQFILLQKLPNFAIYLTVCSITGKNVCLFFKSFNENLKFAVSAYCFLGLKMTLCMYCAGRSVFRTQSNIYSGAFLLVAVNYFRKKSFIVDVR